MKGKFVVPTATRVHEAPERAKGGQEVSGLKERVRDGLYVTVTMATSGATC